MAMARLEPSHPFLEATDFVEAAKFWNIDANYELAKGISYLTVKS